MGGEDIVKIQSHDFMSFPLVRFENNQIVFNRHVLDSLEIDPSTKYKVITIVGRARTGKSTFLNLLISYLNNNDELIFKSNSGIDHCTHGIDIYIDNNIIFLDCQGIEYQDSSNDIQLLLLAYLLSNVIIFNDHQLNNGTLKSLEPIISFVNYIEVTDLKKPDLFFRIRDYDMDSSVASLLTNFLTRQDDQYQTIRDSLFDLFENIDSISTGSLDRKELKHLKECKYGTILDCKDNKFEECFNNLITKISTYKSITFSRFMENIDNISELLNNNSRLDFNKLDLCHTLIKTEIVEFINNIDKRVYTNLNVTGTQHNYNIVVKPRIKQTNTIFDTFDNNFKFVNSNIKDNYRQKLFEELNQPIITATEYCVDACHDKFSELFLKFKSNIDEYIANFSEECFIQQSNKVVQEIKFSEVLFENRKILYECNDMYKPRFTTLINDTNINIVKSIEQAYNITKRNIENINMYYNTTIDYINSIDINYFITNVKINVFDTFADMETKLRNVIMKELETLIDGFRWDKFSRFNYNFIIDTVRTKFERVGAYNFNNPLTYLGHFDFKKFFEQPAVKNFYVEHKKQLVVNHIENSSNINEKLYTSNPEIQFYKFSQINQDEYVTKKLSLYLETILPAKKVFIQDELSKYFDFKLVPHKKFMEIFNINNDIVIDYNKIEHYYIIELIVKDSIKHILNLDYL